MDCSEIKNVVCYLFEPTYLYTLGALCILLVIFVLLRKRQPKSIVAYRTENGNVTISRSAVVELVRTSCEQLSQVNKPSLKVFTKRGLTHFTIRIQLTSGGRLKDVEETLQNHLRENLSQNLGIENLGDINIVVTSIKSSRVRAANDTSTNYASSTPPSEPYEQNSEDSEPDEPEKQ